MAATGASLVIAALLLTVFDDKWEPIVIHFLRRHESVSFLSSIVPSVSLMLLLLGAYLGVKSKEAPKDSNN